MSWLDDFQVQIAQQLNEGKEKLVETANSYLKNQAKEALTKALPTKEANYGNKNEADLAAENALPQVVASAAKSYWPYLIVAGAAYFLFAKKRRG